MLTFASRIWDFSQNCNLFHAGVNISRSPGAGSSSAASASLSPRWLNSLSGNVNNRNRSSSLIVPPVVPRQKAPSSSGSPGSKSLHLSPGLRSDKLRTNTPKSATLFTFPDPSTTGSGDNDSGLSSVVHVDRYLSSEDFHEALFFEISPRSGQKKRRKSSSNSKKNSENSNTQQQQQPLCVTLI